MFIYYIYFENCPMETNNLENITQKKYGVIGLKDMKDSLKYTIFASMLITGLYVGSYLLTDHERDKKFKKIVDEANVIELCESAFGYIQTFRAENMDSDPSLLEYYLQKIIKYNPNFMHDFVVRKALDLNKDGKVGNDY